MNTKFILLLSFFLLTTPKLIFADGGGHSEEKPTPSLIEETDSFNDSIYSIGDEEVSNPHSIDENLLGSPFSSINSLVSGFKQRSLYLKDEKIIGFIALCPVAESGSKTHCVSVHLF